MKQSKLIIIFFFTLFINEISRAESKIYVVDLNFIYSNSNAGKKLNNQIQDKSQKLNSEFNSFKIQIDKKKKNLVNQKNILAKEEYEKKLVKLENEIKEFNSSISKKQDELLNIRKESKVKFSNEIRNILAEYSKDNSIDIILKKESILIGKTNLDITNSIFDIFNKKLKNF